MPIRDYPSTKIGDFSWMKGCYMDAIYVKKIELLYLILFGRYVHHVKHLHTFGQLISQFNRSGISHVKKDHWKQIIFSFERD